MPCVSPTRVSQQGRSAWTEQPHYDIERDKDHAACTESHPWICPPGRPQPSRRPACRRLLRAVPERDAQRRRPDPHPGHTGQRGRYQHLHPGRERLHHHH